MSVNKTKNYFKKISFPECRKRQLQILYQFRKLKKSDVHFVLVSWNIEFKWSFTVPLILHEFSIPLKEEEFKFVKPIIQNNSNSNEKYEQLTFIEKKFLQEIVLAAFLLSTEVIALFLAFMYFHFGISHHFMNKTRLVARKDDIYAFRLKCHWIILNHKTKSDYMHWYSTFE